MSTLIRNTDNKIYFILCLTLLLCFTTLYVCASVTNCKASALAQQVRIRHVMNAFSPSRTLSFHQHAPSPPSLHLHSCAYAPVVPLSLSPLPPASVCKHIHSYVNSRLVLPLTTCANANQRAQSFVPIPNPSIPSIHPSTSPRV